MSIVVQKGNGFTGSYTASEIATAIDWTGTVSVYATYPGGAVIFSKTLALSTDGTKLEFVFSPADILNLDAEVYSVAGHLLSTSLGVDTYRLDYMTITDPSVISADMTLLTMTLAKIDGTPPGEAIKTLQNTPTGSTIINGWRGVTVTARQEDAYNIGTEIIGTEDISATTNAVGYAQLAVIKGTTVTVSCPSFGKTVTVDTTGHDTIDLSTYF
jgi:hypothetical protein